ncbi:M48 family metalloprotease [Alkalicaulis satelles]|uniref:M48 family metalloprotease n=1 Tax=Alkalicaulis satelles TaxID=2609175 RepID=A0A5M6ZKV5_9PROT|nr:M48 family metalloprotease [Alkalicaulis satelles]KAA5805482.1 M48 family metalloprotease [Alkalicaulis satelles]
MPFIRRTTAWLAAAAASAGLTCAPALSQGLVRDAEIEEVMRAWSDPMIEAAGLNVNSVDMYLIGDMEFNAFVTRGQKIFLHTGLIVQAHNPNEIKGVIAHEIGHIEGAHLVRMQQAERSAMATMAAAIGVGIIAALAGAGDAGAAIIASSPQFATLDFMTYTRAQEAAADQAAVRFLTATGQSGRGLVSTFERLAYQERLSFQRRWQYMRSHPLSSDRVRALQRNVEASPYADVEDSPEDIETLERIQAKIIGFMVPPAQTFERYPESDTSIPARYARAVAFYKQGLMSRAEEVVLTLIADEPDNPYFHELHGQMLFESGHIERSLEPYRRSLELAPGQPLLQIGLATALIAQGGQDEVNEAVRLLSQALVSEPNNPFGWFQKSLAHTELGQIAHAELATAERYFAVGDSMHAHLFARRAHDRLERGTEAWVRSAELLYATEPSAREIREWNRREHQRPNFGRGGQRP